MAAVLNPWSCSSSSTPQLQLLLLFHFLVVVPATSLNFSYDHTFTTNDFRQEDDAMVIAGRIELLGVEFTERGRGRALYQQPMQLWDEATGEEASFEASFNFTITSATGKNSSQAGHGMAFFLAPFMPDFPQDCYDGCLGLLDKSLTATSGAGAMGNASGAARFVAVEFDTHKDAWDPSPRHVGVDVDNVDSLSREDYVVVLPDDSLVDAGVLSATVAYDGGARRLNVTLAGDGATYRRLSAAIHLRSLLPEQVAVGFSAATSDEFTSNHTVLSCKFSSTLPTRTPSATSPPSSKPAHLIAATAAAGAAVLLLLAVSIFVLIRRRNGSGNGSDGDESSLIDSSGDGEFESGSTGPRRIPYAHLAAATRDFAEDGKLGQGGSGSVYGGHVTEMGRDVAIKVFTRGASMEGRKEYRSEVTVISRLRHRNLVQLIGWCHGRRRLLLVYELVRNGSLDGYLYDGKEETLTWPIRYHIILGLASAVQYLHQEWDQCVVHGDIKPSNIMLDESFNAKLGDFGLARLIDHGMSLQTMTAVAGTPGYLDPECVITGRASAESDMYSFGVVLLEVVCGRRPMIVAPRASADDDDGDGEGQGQVFRLVEWAWELYGRGATEALADARLGGEFDRWEMARVVGVGLWCAHPDPKARPGIRQAAEALQSRKFRMPVLPPRMPVAVYLQPFETSTMKYYSDLSMSSVVSDSEAVGYSSASRTTVTQSSGCSLPPGPLGDSSSPRE